MPSRETVSVPFKYATQYDNSTGWHGDGYAMSRYELEHMFWSQGHWGWQNLSVNNVGGSFGLETYQKNPGLVPQNIVKRPNHYEGIDGFAYIAAEDITSFGHPDGASSGATAYSRMKPTSPDFAGLNALYELKDLPRMVQQMRETFAKNFSHIEDYYLALQFGYKPLLNDIRNVVSTQRGAQARLKQLLRDNGKPVRRKITIAETNETVPSMGDAYPPLLLGVPGDWVTSIPHYTRSVRTYDRVWASARFRYWLPDGPRDINWQRRMLARIYGLNISPSVLYNAIPWTWLIDWFSNAGDCIDNLDAGVADRLAADYFYVMRTSGVSVKTDVQWGAFTKGGVSSFAGSSSSFREVKTRLVGDPFGFSTNENSLSSTQLSILGALGMSRLR